MTDYTISKELLTNILNYFVKRPYEEALPYCNDIQNLQPSKEKELREEVEALSIKCNALTSTPEATSEQV